MREPKVLGESGEVLAEINFHALNANAEIVSNCATIDVFCNEKMISVKTYESFNASNYRQALRSVVGADAERGLYSKTHDPANMCVAEQFLSLKKNNPLKWQSLRNFLPQDVWLANTEKTMSKALGKHGYVAISHDHVDRARQDIARNVKENAHAWRGSSVPLNELPNRIIPFDPYISSGDLCNRLYREE